MTSRRQFLSTLGSAPLVARGRAARPNILFILTDDQGFGDLSIHGNKQLQTPNMDRIGREGVRFTQFQVCPVCSPTRSCLMTGRYNYRTAVIDTYMGRSMLRPEEVTLAQMLRGAGYRTGIFGKWHLGDNYPMRAMDKGFEEALVIRGGGLAQPSDPPDSHLSYFDPILQHNGKPERSHGYCTDVFTNAALEFVEKHHSEPFFVYLPANAPHRPLQVEERYVEPFRRAGLDDFTAGVYGMVTNLDENIGRLLRKLTELKLDRDTIVIFMTDNGPDSLRYNAGMRGKKGEPYQGGIRVPFFVRWPAKFRGGKTVDRIAANIDLFPTLLDACNVPLPKDRKIDGRSLMPLMTRGAAHWPDRTLITQWHRGDEPTAFRNSALRTQRYKLINGTELYNLENDPSEREDLAAAEPQVLARLSGEYMAWFSDVSSKGYAPPRIYLGTSHEDPVVLTQQDWRGPFAGTRKDSLGYWEVDVRKAATYEIRLIVHPSQTAGQAEFRLNGAKLTAPVPRGETMVILGRTSIPAGPGRLEAEVTYGETKPIGVRFVEVRQ